jgi:hypothetical protein
MVVVFDRVGAATRTSSLFDSRDPVVVFESLHVYIEFDVNQVGRRPVVDTFGGHPGQWICAYSSLDRLREARGEDVEYSCVRGLTVLAQYVSEAGLWYDHGYDGPKILLPPAAFQVDVPDEIGVDTATEPTRNSHA